MSHTQLIKDTLNILDLNIYFEENCLTKEKYKGQICLNYKAPLSCQRLGPLMSLVIQNYLDLIGG